MFPRCYLEYVLESSIVSDAYSRPVEWRPNYEQWPTFKRRQLEQYNIKCAARQNPRLTQVLV